MGLLGDLSTSLEKSAELCYLFTDARLEKIFFKNLNLVLLASVCPDAGTE